MTKALHFWYEFASPYSYLAAMRIGDLARSRGVEVVWHPFLLGAIYKMMNLPGLPMEQSPQKFAYMWLDAARQAKRLGIAFKRPGVFPRVAILPARVALLGRAEGWCPEFSKRVYQANFVADLEIGEDRVVRAILEEMGRDAGDVIARATADANKEALKRETAQAFENGVFGVPTFFVEGEIFWGNDRLEQALEAAAS